jgi:predicted transcriptional regulator of viral defense system
MAKRQTYDELIWLAAEQHGWVRTDDAEAAGINPAYLRKLAAAGKAEHRAYGLYRMNAIPPTPLDEYHEAVLRTRGEGAVAGDAALALWELADVNPRTIDVVMWAGQRMRPKLPRHIRVRQRRLTPDQIEHVDGIPVLAPPVAIANAIDDGIEGGLAAQAIATARRRELIGQVEEARLLVRLADRNRTAHSKERTLIAAG